MLIERELVEVSQTASGQFDVFVFIIMNYSTVNASTRKWQTLKLK